MQPLEASKVGVEFTSTPLPSRFGTILAFVALFLLYAAEGFAPRTIKQLAISNDDVRFFAVALGLLAMVLSIACLVRTRLVVRREQRDLVRKLLGLVWWTVVRTGEAKSLKLEAKGRAAQLSVEKAGGKSLILTESVDVLMVEAAARESAQVLSVALEDLRPAPPHAIRYEESEGDLPFYKQDPDGVSRAVVGVNVRRAPGLIELRVRPLVSSDADPLSVLMVLAAFVLLLFAIFAFAKNAPRPGDYGYLRALVMPMVAIPSGLSLALAIAVVAASS